MILLRAIFWVAVAVIMIPRDPHLGVEPMQTASMNSPTALRDAMLVRIYQVKADLAAQEARLASISK
ncbi:MAG TPA: hypothetical protein VGT78_11730 [Rhizomicrobium sp.]|nr:hypothetical protein [Rhizomicrobium sp.]